MLSHEITLAPLIFQSGVAMVHKSSEVLRALDRWPDELRFVFKFTVEVVEFGFEIRELSFSPSCDF